MNNGSSPDLKLEGARDVDASIGAKNRHIDGAIAFPHAHEAFRIGKLQKIWKGEAPVRRL